MRLELYDIRCFNVVEFNITGDRESFRTGDLNSRFMDTEVFNLFVHCFERSNRLYDYSEPTRYNARTLIPLKNALAANLRILEGISGKADFLETVCGCFLGRDFLSSLGQADPCWEENWQNYRDKLAGINRDLVFLVDRCLEEDMVLWIRGY